MLKKKLLFLSWVSLFACATKQENVKKADKVPQKETKTPQQKEDKKLQEKDRYTFGRWTLSQPLSQAKPRGGTTEGAAVEFTDANKNYKKLMVAEGTQIEKDRAAILAMEGPYQATFEFLETMGFSQDYQIDRPYQSWGTEYIYVIENKEKFISLQHILVMFIKQEDKVIGPHVIKHWRQDWSYEDNTLHRYQGNGKFKAKTVPKAEAKGKWLQSVFQVDDSPRYQVLGRWHHEEGVSYWESDNAPRPLPRREFSVRDDYNVLSGKHRISITPTGWIHEQNNLKLKVEETGKQKPLAREIGINRYNRLKNFDFSAGDKYWEKTKEFWHEMRAAWDKVFKKHDVFRVKKEAYGKSLYEVAFQAAEETADKRKSDKRKAVDKIIDNFIEIP